MKNHAEKKELLSRVITFLSREELDYIDKISKDSLFTTGTKLPRAKVVEAMVEACRKAGISGEGIHNKEELINKIFNEVAKKALEKRSLATDMKNEGSSGRFSEWKEEGKSK